MEYIYIFLNKIVKVKNKGIQIRNNLPNVIQADFTEYILNSDLKVPCFPLQHSEGEKNFRSKNIITKAKAPFTS